MGNPKVARRGAGWKRRGAFPSHETGCVCPPVRLSENRALCSRRRMTIVVWAVSTVVKLSWAGFYWQEFRARATSRHIVTTKMHNNCT